MGSNENAIKMDYKDEYNRLVSLHEKLLAERDKLREEVVYYKQSLEDLESEAHRMRAQFDIVHLIFGGK